MKAALFGFEFHIASALVTLVVKYLAEYVLQVGKRHSVDGVYSLKIERGIIGIAAEDEGAALAEGEVLLDDILYGDAIGAMGEGVGAEEIERPLIIIGGAQHAVALHGDVVVGVAVHQQADGGVGGAVDVEI